MWKIFPIYWCKPNHPAIWFGAPLANLQHTWQPVKKPVPTCKRTCERTCKDLQKKTKITIRRFFHRLPSVLQVRPKRPKPSGVVWLCGCSPPPPFRNVFFGCPKFFPGLFFPRHKRFGLLFFSSSTTLFQPVFVSLHPKTRTTFPASSAIFLCCPEGLFLQRLLPEARGFPLWQLLAALALLAVFRSLLSLSRQFSPFVFPSSGVSLLPASL